MTILFFAAAPLFACAPEPSLSDPYAENGYFSPYVDDVDAKVSVCESQPFDYLGYRQDGTPRVAVDCGESMNTEFPLCVRINADNKLQFFWDEGEGFAFFVTEKAAILPTGPENPVQNGKTFWAIGPETFSERFASPLTYGVVPSGMKDVTEDHDGAMGGAVLESGYCYKFSVINGAFRTGVLVVGWE